MQSCSICSFCVDNTHDTYIAHRDVWHVEGSFNPVSGKAGIEHKSNFENLNTGNSNTLAYTVNCIVFVNFSHYFNFIAHDIYKNVQVKLHVYFHLSFCILNFMFLPCTTNFAEGAHTWAGLI